MGGKWFRLAGMSDDDYIPDIDDPRPPRLMRGLRGHAQAQDEFLQSCHSARLAHAWILYGAKGVGKASFAFHVARHFMATPQLSDITQLATPPDSATNDLVESESHPDLVVLKRRWVLRNSRFQSAIPADDARAVRKPLQRTAAYGGWRLVIIDSIDEMNPTGINSLLKMIEEPPQRVLFLIVCHRLGRVPDTIRSRCRHLHFGLLANEDVAALLAQHFPKLTTEARDLAVFLGEGSAARACRVAAHGGTEIYTQFMEVVAHLPQPDVKAMHTLASQFVVKSKPEQFPIFCDLLGGWLHRLVQARSGRSGGQLASLPAQEAAFINQWGAQVPLITAVNVWEEIQKQTRQVDALNLDKKQATLEWLGMLRQLIPTKTAA